MHRLVLILVVALVACALGQTYALKSSVIDEGGRRTASAGYVAHLSLGQQIASSTVSSTSYHAILGFWHAGFVPGIQEPVNTIVAEPSFALDQNVPNPFNHRALINYSLTDEAEVDLRVFDRGGRVIATLVSGRQNAGRYRVTWSLDSRARAELANGVYFYRLTAGENTATRKMVKMP